MKRAGPAVVALLAVLFGWALVEFAGRVALGMEPAIDDRVALFTRPNWRADGRGVRWAADARIRTLAIYGERVEYDVRFATNDLGYIDHRDYRPATPVPVERRWVFVGDSFTAGHHGGTPWVPALRDAAAQLDAPLEIYNLGVSGVGIYQFLPNLNAADRELDFAHIAFLLISDDLARRPWRPVESAGRIVLCPSEVDETDCAKSTAPMFALDDPEASHAQIFAWLRAEKVLRTGPLAWLKRRSIVAAALRRPGSGAASGDAGLAEPEAAGRADLGGWLAALARRHGERELHFLQVPEKTEVRRGALRIPLGEALAGTGHPYVSLLDACDLRPEHYFERDPHMNAAGYAVLRDCVGRELGLLPATPSDDD